MEERLKRRLVGAVVLVSLAVIFLPMLVEQEQEQGGEVRIGSTNIPERPADTSKFRSSVLPLPLNEPLIPALVDEEPSTPAVEAPDEVPPQVSEPEETPRLGLSAWVVQVASLSSRDASERLQTELRSKGYTAFVEPVSVKGRDLYRVRVGPELDRKRAEAMLEQIHQAFSIKGQVIRYP